MKKYALYLFLLAPLFILSHKIDRNQFEWLIGLIFVSFTAYFFLLKEKNTQKKEIIIIALLARVMLLFSVPNLSDDYYRFIWDGQQIIAGQNPYEKLPEEIILSKENNSGYTQKLYTNLNSPSYYTVYPPVNQSIFGLSAWIGGKNLTLNILVLKLILVGFEMGLLFLLFRLLNQLKLAHNLVMIYALNPLVIIEIAGNIHFEGILLFFILLALYFVFQKQFLWSALCVALAINTKLIPIMLLPLAIPYLGVKKGGIYLFQIVFFTVLMFIPFLSSELLINFGSSIDLYFQKFEFNASIYYLLRWIGIWFTGYNLIATIGYILPLFVISFIGYKMLFSGHPKTKTTFFKDALQILFLYYILAAVVHHWYLISLVLLSVFIYNNKAILIWSGMVFLSYFAYSNYIQFYFEGDKHQSALYFLAVFIEYLTVFGVLYVLRPKRSL